MSRTKELKEYLINEDDGFLLNPDNNSKTIMLSGAWGAGKTHFWQNEIEPLLSDKLKYVLDVERGIEKKTFDRINKFIKIGILPKQTKEVETLVPLEAVTAIKV